MSGGLAEYRRALEERQFRAIAMSVLASGAISPVEAFEWIAQFPRIESVVFGASTVGHIRDTKAIAESVWGQPEVGTTLPYDAEPEALAASMGRAS